MKRLLLFLVIFANIYSCNNNDDDINISAINGFIGQWTLQSRVLNNDFPLPIENEKLRFTEDDNLSDFSGNYEFITSANSNGSFDIDIYNTMAFSSNNGNSITYDFIINNITLNFSYVDSNGDNISEVWIKG